MPDVNTGHTLLSPAQALARAQDSIDRAASYHLELLGHNFVLPQWGGINYASLDISATAAQGTVQRTGEAAYTIRFANGQTYFQRETCDRFARIPGGGPTVLRPLAWIQSDRLRQAASPAYVSDPSDDPLILEARFDDLGQVRIALERATFRPLRLVGSESTWVFSAWGKAVNVQPPSAILGDRGPGGNPCS